MPLISSPPAYPPRSCSPPQLITCRKRSQITELHPFPKKRQLDTQSDATSQKRPLQSIFDLPKVTSGQFWLRDSQSRKPEGPFVDDIDNDVDDDQCVTNKNPSMHSLIPEDHVKALSASPLRTPKSFPDESQCSLYHASRIKTSSGKLFTANVRKVRDPVTKEQLIHGKLRTAQSKAMKSFYNVDIHKLLDSAVNDDQHKKAVSQSPVNHRTNQEPVALKGPRKGQTMLWTEKYRAKKFTDLVGDERTHREVLRWLKSWDAIVYPGTRRLQPRTNLIGSETDTRQPRKILLINGPPGLGKTTLAHVCARQAGYEVVEINASDERSRDLVRGKIRDCVGTENVKGPIMKDRGKRTRKAGKPVCVIVDEVDGVVSGSSGGGEGGFIKALIDLAILDRKSSNLLGATSPNHVTSKDKTDGFRFLRPLILICNDVYCPALRPLRLSTMVEIVHIRRPTLDKVAARLRSVFDKEGVLNDGDGVRRLCEATWGVNKRESRSNATGAGDGDMRGLLIVGEWVATKMRASFGEHTRLTKEWVEEHMLGTLMHDGGGARGLGRGDTKEVVNRVFSDGAGSSTRLFSGTSEQPPGIRDGDLGVSELAKRAAMDHLRDIIDASGESDRIITDCFAEYPKHSFHDDTVLSKPNSAYEWLHFHDRLSTRVHVGQEWELTPYLSQSILGFHHLFASPEKQSWANDQEKWGDGEEPLPFSGPRADFQASEALKQNRSIILGFQSSLPIPLLRSVESVEHISLDLVPHVIRMLTPNVKPIAVGGSGEQRGIVRVRKGGEQEMIERALVVMREVGVIFERARVEAGQNCASSYIYRMEP